ncbi:MAG TPA: glycosyltransferase family 1 protein [Saprospiraceae bacterium]|nr:glycosyltransferase family 1 protein [Saprospiraceae bacterium]
MKIAFIADPLDNQNAGVHIYTKAVVEELARDNRGHEILLIRQKKDGNWPELEQIVIPSYRFPGFASLRLFVLVPFMLRKAKADIVLEPAHFGPFNLPKSVIRATFIHDLTPIKFPKYHRWHSQFLQKLFLGRILKKSKKIITNSRNTSRDLEFYYPITIGKNKPIPLAVDSIFKPDHNSILPKALLFETPYFINLGTIEPRKNIVRLLAAYEKFRDVSDKKCLLVIVGGEGWKTGEIMSSIKSHKYHSDIIRPGFIPTDMLPQLMKNSVCLIYPSLYEGFGLPILEAFSVGCPVICSKSSSMPEVGGEAAFYFDPNQTEELVDRMLEMANFDKKSRDIIVQKSLHQASQFSWKKHVDDLIKYLVS